MLIFSSKPYFVMGQGCVHRCETLVSNGDLEIDNVTYPITTGFATKSFQRNWVKNGMNDFWHSSHNSPHHVQYQPNNCNLNWTQPNGTEVNCISSNTNFTEGIFTNINSNGDRLTDYCITLNVQNLQCGFGSVTNNVELAFTSGLTPVPESQSSTTSLPSNQKQIIHTQTIGPSVFNVIPINASYTPNGVNVFNQFWIYSYGRSGSGTAFTTINNVNITCTTRALTGINLNQNGNTINPIAINSSEVSTFVSYVWDFGDGNTSTEAEPTHTYQGNGPFSVCVAIVDNNGCCNSVCSSINLMCETPVGHIDFSGDCPTFDFTILGGNNNVTGFSYLWDFDVDDVNSPTGNGKFVSYTYTEGGQFTVTCVVTNACGQSAEFTVQVTVDLPVPSFTVSGICPSYTFTAPFVNSYMYLWDFGDGSTNGTGNMVSHSYNSNGTKVVKLTVTNSCGSVIITQNVEVNCIGPSSSCTNQSGCISIGTDISSQILLSDLINGTNPIIPNTPVYFGYEIKNQCFSLEGELVIDVWHATFNNTKWYCAPGSSIRIPNYGLFGSHWFINSTLQGCEKMWRGIIYEGLPSAPFLGSAGIALQGTTIKDAWHGVEMGNNTTITTYGSSFIDNYIGIFVAPNLGVSQKIVTDIRNTNFIYDGTMLPMYTGQPEWNQRSHAGIRVHNLAQLNVKGGLFQNVQIGIRAINTSSNIQSAHFEDTDLFSSNGILIESAGPLTDITNQNLFTNLFTSIKLDGGSRAVIRISDNDFFNNRPNPNNIGYKGVWVLNHPASSLRINQQNTFNFIYGTAVEVTTALSYMQISDNDFTISGPDLTPIVLDGIKEASFVDNNDFFVGNGFRGKVMEIKNCQKIEFLSNIMHNGTATASSTGFDVRGSTQCLFRNNQVLFPGQGFYINGGQASQNNYCCNTANQANPQSFNFIGANLKSNLKQNTLRKLRLSGDIGQQLSAGNIWGSSSIGWLVDGDQSKAFNNRFTTTFATNARPTTITPVAIAPFWFIPTGTSTTCATTPTCGLKNFFTGPLDPDLTLSGPYTPTVTPPSGDCFEFLNSIKDFLPLGTSTNDADLITYWNAAGLLENWQIEHGKVFWDDCKDSLKGDPVVKEWIDVERVKDLVLTPDGPLRSDGAAAMTDILNASAQISALHPLVLKSIPTTVFTAYEQMATATDAYQVVTTSMGTSAATKAAALLPQVAALPTSKSFLVDRKKVWTVELKIIATGVSSVTNAEWDEVRTIAQKCPLTSGQAVYEAQSLMKVIGKYYSSDIDIDCTTPKLRSIEITQEESEVSIHPNPSNGLFTINWPEDKMIDQIVISDISGRTVTQISVGNKRNVLIDLSSQHPGVYFYKVTFGNAQVAQGKMIIIK